MQDPVHPLVDRQLDLRNVDGRGRGAVVHELYELLGDLAADRLLRFHRGAADVGRENGVRQRLQRRAEALAPARRLAREHVHGGAGEPARAELIGERVQVHDVATAVVDEAGAVLHPREHLAPEQPLRLRGAGHVQRDDVRRLEQLVERADRTRVAERELRHDVVIDHAHSERLCQHGHLRADVPVADDAERLAASLATAFRALQPPAFVRREVLFRDGAQQCDAVAHHELRDRARVRERSVEDRHAQRRGGRQVDLVRADAERADRQQPTSGGEHLLAQLRLRPDPEHVRVGDPLFQLGRPERAGDGLHPEALLPEPIDGDPMDPLQQQDLDPVLRKRRSLHRPFRYRRVSRVLFLHRPLPSLSRHRSFPAAAAPQFFSDC